VAIERSQDPLVSIVSTPIMFTTLLLEKFNLKKSGRAAINDRLTLPRLDRLKKLKVMYIEKSRDDQIKKYFLRLRDGVPSELTELVILRIWIILLGAKGLCLGSLLKALGALDPDQVKYIEYIKGSSLERRWNRK
jgi:hypothetical protein